mgnify:CR=1 FL=1
MMRRRFFGGVVGGLLAIGLFGDALLHGLTRVRHTPPPSVERAQVVIEEVPGGVKYWSSGDVDVVLTPPPSRVEKKDHGLQTPIRFAEPPTCQPSGVDLDTYARWRRACLREQEHERMRELERAYRAHLAREGLAPATTHLPIGGF